MASTVKFDPDKVPGDKITNKSPEELCALASGICAAVIDRTAGSEYRGGICPDNISVDENSTVALGPVTSGNTDASGFTAPECYRSEKPGSPADVYSIGMLLYYAVSGGKLPFEETDEPAAALEKLRNGEPFDIPEAAGSELGSIIKKAVSYDPADRYGSVVKLKAALDACIGGEACEDADSASHEIESTMAAILGGISEENEPAEEEVEEDAPAEEETEEDETEESTEEELPSEEVERPAVVQLREEPNPELEPIVVAKPPMQYIHAAEREKNIAEKVRRRRRRPIIFILAVCALLVVSALIYGGVSDDKPAHTPAPASTPVPSTIVEPIVSPPVESAQPVEPVEPVVKEHTYQLYVEDVSWEKAAERCREKGGYLVTIDSEEEFNRIVALTESYGIKMVWIGGRRVDGTIVWESGETVEFYAWDHGEPSYRDSYDGATEDCILLWYHNDWCYNDSRNDPVSYYPAAYSGKIAYICEFEG